MYAIIEAGGRQYRVEPEDVLTVERMKVEAGETVSLERVALLERDGEVLVGAPWVEGAAVKCRVLGHGRGRKVDVFFFKAKENIKRKVGHRQPYTRLRVEEIAGGPAGIEKES